MFSDIEKVKMCVAHAPDVDEASRELRYFRYSTQFRVWHTRPNIHRGAGILRGIGQREQTRHGGGEISSNPNSQEVPPPPPPRAFGNAKVSSLRAGAVYFMTDCSLGA